MRNIKSFGDYKLNEGNPMSPYLKDLGEFFPISELKAGQKVNYQGQTMFVTEPGEYVVHLNKSQEAGISGSIKVNQNMFTQFALILKGE